MRFDYLIDKILKEDFIKEPFKHIYIEDFFEEEDFNSIVNNSEITLEKCSSDEELFNKMFDNNYKVIPFPGCTTDYKEYIKKHSANEPLTSHTATESAGVVLRLYPKNKTLIELSEFLLSKDFNNAIAEKFGLEYENCDIDGGMQKYLDGYEISPHPDIRLKAATYMVNINPDQKSENLNHHTHYLKFKPEFEYVKNFWADNPNADRQWVPWDWCTTEFLQKKNNSIVIFSPDNDTIHGVKTNYDHLSMQRTQLYGNLWYKSSNTTYSPSWEQLLIKDFSSKKHNHPNKTLDTFKRLLKKSVEIFSKKDLNIGDRKH